MISGGLSVAESNAVKPGTMILAGQTTFVHPLDFLLLTYPHLSPVERVMVLVDRIYNAAVERLD